VLENNISENIRTEFAAILTQLPSIVLVQPEFEDSATLFPKETEVISGLNLTEEIKPMTHPEFTGFLSQLFIQDKEKGSQQPPSRATVKSAVDFLIRLKLKTVVGRAQDFFTQLQYVFRKARRGNSIQLWKLDFAYELEKKINLCIYQSSFLPCNIPEVCSIAYFYKMTVEM